jgi:GDPmannose 4,6-dehydratase
VDLLLSDPSKAKAKLGWEASTQLQTLCSEMIASDAAELERELHGTIKCPP